MLSNQHEFWHVVKGSLINMEEGSENNGLGRKKGGTKKANFIVLSKRTSIIFELKKIIGVRRQHSQRPV